jgi:hypothetical protein
MLRKSAKGVSLATVRRLWQQYNESVFDCRLLEPVFRITRAGAYFGKVVYRQSDNGARVVFHISGPQHPGGAGLDDTILHEMIHQWQILSGLKENEHDETFTQWLPIIEEKTGIKLQNSWDDGQGVVG